MSEDTTIGTETDPRDSFAWNVYSKNGVHGVRCIYDKKSKLLSVERSGSSSSTYAPTLTKARKEARVLAARELSILEKREVLIEMQRLLERHLR